MAYTRQYRSWGRRGSGCLEIWELTLPRALFQFAKPLMPFFIASAITFYGVVKAQEAGVNSELRCRECRNLSNALPIAPEAMANVC